MIGVEPSKHLRSAANQTCARWIEEEPDIIEFVESLKHVSTTPKFDLIVISHVVEHLFDPVKYLRALKNKYLAEGGSILIEVPNFFGKAASVFDFPHLHYFHDATLRLLMKKAGLHIHYAETQGSWPPFWVIPKFLLVIVRAKKPTYDKEAMGLKFMLHQQYVHHIAKMRIDDDKDNNS